MTNYIAYYRVSTQKQGVSGLGLDAQQDTVRRFAANGILLSEFTDIESGKNNNRPNLMQALEFAKKQNATLLVAKLDRLSRNIVFITTLMEAKVRFICCDMPEANELTIHLMAALAQWERKQISRRTKEALAAKMARCKDTGFIDRNGELRMTLGNPSNFTQVGRLAGATTNREKAANSKLNKSAGAYAVSLRYQGKTMDQIATAMNEYGFTAPRGGRINSEQVRRLLNQTEIVVR